MYKSCEHSIDSAHDIHPHNPVLNVASGFLQFLQQFVKTHRHTTKMAFSRLKPHHSPISHFSLILNKAPFYFSYVHLSWYYNFFFGVRKKNNLELFFGNCAWLPSSLLGSHNNYVAKGPVVCKPCISVSLWSSEVTATE